MTFHLRTPSTLLASACLLSAGAARAGAVDVEAKGCPEAAGLAQRIEEKSPGGRDARIRITKNERGFRGEVALGHGDAAVERAVDARSCAAVVEALVLVAALDAAPAADSAEDAPSGDGPPASSGAAASSGVAVSAPPRAAPDADARPQREVPREGAEIALGASTFATPLHPGNVTQGFAVLVDVGWKQGLLGSGALLPSVRGALARTFFATGDGPLDLTRTTAQLDGCPVGIDVPGVVRLGACARFEAGALRVSSPGHLPATRFYAAAGAQARARWSPTPRGHVRPFVELGLGLTAPLFRDTFVRSSAPRGEEAFVSFVSPLLPRVLWDATLAAGVVLP